MMLRGPQLLREFMAATGMTQAAIAAGIGRAEATVSLWLNPDPERARVPDTESSVRLEQFTRQVSPDHAVPTGAWANGLPTPTTPDDSEPPEAPAQGEGSGREVA